MIQFEKSGYIPSPFTPNERYFESQIGIPASFLCKGCETVYDQRNTPLCGAYTMLSIIEAQSKTVHKHIKIDVRDLYSKKSTKGDGMSPRDIFTILKTQGVKSNVGITKIVTFTRLGSYENIKRALILNGPVFLAMSVKSNEEKFWLGDKLLGGHAVTLVGYNDKTRMWTFKNSYGTTYGNNGFMEIPYSEMVACNEAWTCETKLF